MGGPLGLLGPQDCPKHHRATQQTLKTPARYAQYFDRSFSDGHKQQEPLTAVVVAVVAAVAALLPAVVQLCCSQQCVPLSFHKASRCQSQRQHSAPNNRSTHGSVPQDGTSADSIQLHNIQAVV